MSDYGKVRVAMYMPDYDRVDTSHDSPEVCVNKLFNMIQKCRVDVACMSGSGKKYYIDPDTIKVAEALAQEVKRLSDDMKEKQ